MDDTIHNRHSHVQIFPEHLPASVLNDPRCSAERLLYEALARLDNEYRVFYSVAWQARTNRGATDGEADFVVAHPDLGLIVIEVKGGGISYDARLKQWYSTDRNGVTHDIKDPADQARTSHHRLLEKLADMPKWNSRWLTIGHMVAFPDVHVGYVALRPDLPPSIILDAASMADLDRALRAGFKYYAGQTRALVRWDTIAWTWSKHCWRARFTSKHPLVLSSTMKTSG